MAHGEKPGAAARNTCQDGRTSDPEGNGDKVGDKVQGRVHPWQELEGEEGGEDDRKTTRSGGSGTDNCIGDTTAAGKRGASDNIGPIEMVEFATQAPHTGTGPPAHSRLGSAAAAAAAADVDGGGTAVPAAGEYKVYKRRWFGLLQLTLLNIIASWDVSGFTYQLHFPARGCSVAAGPTPDCSAPASQKSETGSVSAGPPPIGPSVQTFRFRGTNTVAGHSMNHAAPYKSHITLKALEVNRPSALMLR